MKLAAAIITLLILAGPAHADDKGPRVGVIVELTVDVDAKRADSLSAALADALNRELVVDAFGGSDVTRQMPTGGLPDECIGTPSCVADVAKRIDADQLIFLVLVQVGGDVQVDASWVDVATGDTRARPRVMLPAEARAVSEFAVHAQRYLPDAKERKRGGDTFILGNKTETIPPTPRSMSTPAWIIAGVGLAALGAGTGLGLSVRSSYQKCEEPPVCSQSTKDGIALRAHLADASFAVGAVAAIATTYLYLRSGSPGGTREIQPEIAPTAGGATVGLSGRW